MEQSKIVKIWVSICSMSGPSGLMIECDLQTQKCKGTGLRIGKRSTFPVIIPECFTNTITEKKVVGLMKSRRHCLAKEELSMMPTDMPRYTIKIEYQGKVHEIHGCWCEIEHVPLFEEMMNAVEIADKCAYHLCNTGYDMAAKQQWFIESDMYFSEDETTQKAWYVWRTLCHETDKPTIKQIEDVCRSYDINFYDAMKWKNRFILKIRNMKQ